MMRSLALVLACVQAAHAAPSGGYSGSNSVGGKDLKMYFYANIDGATFDVTFEGALAFECSQSPTKTGER